MDTLQVLALIIVALLILAVIIAFRRRIAVLLEGWGLKFKIEAENPDPKRTPLAKPTPPPPAGVRVADSQVGGGTLIEEGYSETGTGIEIERLKTKEDLIIGKGESGGPKAEPPA